MDSVIHIYANDNAPANSHRWPFTYADGAAEVALGTDIFYADAEPLGSGAWPVVIHARDGRKLPGVAMLWEDGPMEGVVVLSSDMPAIARAAAVWSARQR